MFPCQLTADRLSPKVGSGAGQGECAGERPGSDCGGWAANRMGAGALQSRKGERYEPEMSAR